MAEKRVCIFCENPDGQLTVEHAYPNWILDFLPGDKTDTTIHASSKLDKPRAWGSKGQTGVRTKTVCEKCNNGWMSRLEVTARERLGPLMLGEHRTLNVATQRLAIIWGLKTSMVFDAASSPSHEMVYTSAERQVLRRHAGPHPAMAYAVFLAQNKTDFELHADDYKLALRRTPFLEGEDPRDSSLTVCRTFVFGQLIMQVMLFRMKAPGECAVIDAAKWSVRSIDITNPAREVTWPPEVAISTPLEFALFRDRWEPETVKAMRLREAERLYRKTKAADG